MGTYNVAQICENGHVITAYFSSSPEFGKKFCDQCGAPTLSKCPHCNADIQGKYESEGVFGFGFDAPRFCHNCGASYPWTQRAMDSLNSLAELTEKLSPKERDQLRSAIDDLVRDTPRTQAAIATLKILAPKIGAEAWAGMRSILIEIATESAKKGLGL
ncbi:MAG: DUF2321 domain-containing protein [Dehalococcoidia bacterium]|nr:DUF2321 domain-containing protein [Dehalococcoidia bacterium]